MNQIRKYIRKVLKESIEEAYPESFNMETFKALRNHAERNRYAAQHLPKIAAGSSRIVYKIDDEKVLKLAKNDKGIAQNETEIQWGNDSYFGSVLARTFDSDDNALWVEMELARKINKHEFKKETGLDLDYVSMYLKNWEAEQNGRRAIFGLDPELAAKINENDFITQVKEFAQSADIEVGDFGHSSSYGIVKRDGHEVLVITDYGLTKDVYSTHYEKPQARRMVSMRESVLELVKKTLKEVFEADVAIEGVLHKALGDYFLENRDEILDNVYSTLSSRTANWAIDQLIEEYPDLEQYREEFIAAAVKEGYFEMTSDKWESGELNEKESETNLNDNFKSWFDGSKVVDASGNPMPVHHGTSKKFSKFNIKKGSQPIIWFTSNKSAVEAGEVGASGKGHIMDLYASIKNPAGWDEYEKYGLGQLKGLGYDGVILPDEDGTFTGFVFEPNQLKSVNNKGEWNPDDKNIYKEDLIKESGGVIKTGRYVYHKSNPNFRKEILKYGLEPQVGDCYLTYAETRGGECIPAIFATNSENKKDWFDSTWDDDVWQIDTSKINNEWRSDEHYFWDKNNKHIVTLDSIPANAIKLIYQGGGKSLEESVEVIDEAHHREEEWKKEIAQVAKQLKVELTNFIGAGVWGIAYEIPGNKVLKITEDDREVNNAKHLAGKKNEFMADIYKVYSIGRKKEKEPSPFQFSAGKKIIVMEKLTPLEKVRPMLRKIIDFSDAFDEYSNEESSWTEMLENGWDEDFDNYLRKQKKGLEDVYSDLLAIYEEADSKGVYLSDMHQENFGIKNGHLAIFDIT